MPNHPNSSTAPAPEARELLATAIECLIALLDLQEPDPDLEPNGGEPFPRLAERGLAASPTN
jgi:hypothetical protein